MGNGLNNKVTKIVILGLDKSGKSTLYHRIKLNKLVLTKPTDGTVCETFRPHLKNSIIKNITIQLLDVNGRKNSRIMWETYLHGASAIIYVIDISDNKRLEEAKFELQGVILSSKSKEIPVLVLLNKIDRERCRSPNYISEYLDLVSIDSKRWWLVKCTCLITGEGLCEAVDSLFELLKKIQATNKIPPFQTNDYILKSLNTHDYTVSE